MQPPHGRLKPAVKDDVTNHLLTEFKSLLGRGVLAPGAKLPPERELAVRFGVSRSSLRHPLKVLETMGVLRQRVGDGTYVTDSASAILSEPLEFLVLIDGISLPDLLDTRLIVEPELAARAARRATTDDLSAMRRSLDAMASETDERELMEQDLAFHETIFTASGNVLCLRLFTLIHRAMATSMLLTSRLVDAQHTLSYHRPIYDAIDRRDADEARRRMIAHLLDAGDLLDRTRSETRTGAISADAIRPISRTARQSPKRPLRP